jgi:hypothetical protein
MSGTGPVRSRLSMHWVVFTESYIGCAQHSGRFERLFENLLQGKNVASSSFEHIEHGVWGQDLTD